MSGFFSISLHFSINDWNFCVVFKDRGGIISSPIAGERNADYDFWTCWTMFMRKFCLLVRIVLAVDTVTISFVAPFVTFARFRALSLTNTVHGIVFIFHFWSVLFVAHTWKACKQTNSC